MFVDFTDPPSTNKGSTLALYFMHVVWHLCCAGAKEMARPLLTQCSEQDLSSLAHFEQTHYPEFTIGNIEKNAVMCRDSPGR